MCLELETGMFAREGRLEIRGICDAFRRRAIQISQVGGKQRVVNQGFRNRIRNGQIAHYIQIIQMGSAAAKSPAGAEDVSVGNESGPVQYARVKRKLGILMRFSGFPAIAPTF